MPRYNTEAELRPWTAAANNISSVMMQLPALRQQLARQREADSLAAELNTARIANLNAGTDYDRARTAGETQDQGGDMQIARALRTLALDPNDTNAVADLFEGTGKSFRHNPKQTSEAIGSLMSTVLARQGSKDFEQMGALQGDAASIANNLANVGMRERIATAGNVTRENIARIGAESREKVARSTPRTVSRDSGLFDPEKREWLVEKPDRPAGNPNNLYDPATRQALVTLGEDLAMAYSDGDTNKVAQIENQIESIKAKSRPATGGGVVIPERPLRSAGKPLDRETATQLLNEANGDKERARQLARERGYSF